MSRNYEELYKKTISFSHKIGKPINYMLSFAHYLKNKKEVDKFVKGVAEEFYSQLPPEKINCIVKDAIHSSFSYSYTQLYLYLDNYFKFDFYRLNKKTRNEYSIEVNESLLLDWGYFNQFDYYRFFEDKFLFSQTFSKYFKRESFVIDQNMEYENFYKKSFKKSLFFKPIDSLCGHGVFKAQLLSDDDVLGAWDKIKKSKQTYVAEEIVENEKSLKEFHPNSVNTLRIVTLVNNDDVEVLGAYQRFGNGGACCDHSNVGAIGALVDIETGVVCTKAVDKHNRPYVYHPFSGKLIPGYSLKNWNKLIEMVKEMAMVVPQVRLVGWDVTINDKEEWVVIEGNHNCGYETIQYFAGGLQSKLDYIRKNERRQK